MSLNLSLFLYSSLIFVVLSIVIVIIFPLVEETTILIYNYETQANEHLKQANLTPVILMAILAVVMNAWWASREPYEEKSTLREMAKIIEDPVCSQMLSNNDIKFPVKITHEQLIGESSVGWLKFAVLQNSKKKPVYTVAIANDNYATTEIRQRSENPIVSISSEIWNLESALSLLKPSDRKTFEKRLRQIMKEVEDKPELAKAFTNQIEKGDEENDT